MLAAAYDFEKAAGRAPGEGDLPQLQQAAAALAAGSSGYQVSPELVESYVQDAEELAPLCAITGGVVSNTVVRALSHVDAPVCNLFLFCLQDGMGVVEDMRS